MHAADPSASNCDCDVTREIRIRFIASRLFMTSLYKNSCCCPAHVVFANHDLAVSYGSLNHHQTLHSAKVPKYAANVQYTFYPPPTKLNLHNLQVRNINQKARERRELLKLAYFRYSFKFLSKRKKLIFV